MAKQAKKFRRQLHELELAVGRPVIVRPDGEGEAEVSPLFVVIFGRQPGATNVTALGVGTLALSTLVLAELDAVAALKAGAIPTNVGIAWVSGSTPHAEARTVSNFGPRETSDDSGLDMWAIELATASKAPRPGGIPPGSVPANGFCIFFPWLTMCQQH
jgi:hypothetical protein